MSARLLVPWCTYLRIKLLNKCGQVVFDDKSPNSGISVFHILMTQQVTDMVHEEASEGLNLESHIGSILIINN